MAPITVSLSPPVAATTGTVPYFSPYIWVSPQGSNRDGTSTASPPADHPVRQRLVVADPHADPVGPALRPRSARACSSCGSPDPSSTSPPPAAMKSGSASDSRSIPFCQVSRLTTMASGPGTSPRPNSSISAARFSALAFERSRRNRVVICRVVVGRPDRLVDAVQDAAADRVGARGDHPLEPHAEFRPHQLLGIGRRHGGDRVGRAPARPSASRYCRGTRRGRGARRARAGAGCRAGRRR